jgi:malate permease and related proteins
MENITLILSKIIFIISLFAAGFVVKKFGLLSDKGEEDFSKIFMNIFWPALIIYSITAKLNSSDIINNISLPVLGLITGLIGFGVGLIFIKMKKYKGDEKKIFLFHTTFNNFSFMVLPFAIAFLPEKGAGLLFIHNLSFILLILTLGIVILSGSSDLKEVLKNLLSPALLATIFSIIIVLLDLNKYIPKTAFDVLETLGNPTITIAMMIAGARIYSLGLKALKFNFWNVSLGFLRLILIPGILFGIGFLLKYLFHISNEVMIIFMLVNFMPVSINSVGMALNYKSSPDLAAEGVVFTHLFSIITVTAYIILMQTFLIDKINLN